jgi:hypothetical protein
MRLLIFAYEVNTSKECRSAFVEVMTAVLLSLTVFLRGEPPAIELVVPNMSV